MLNSNRLSRFRVCLMASLVIGAAVTPAVGGEQYHKPKIRTITSLKTSTLSSGQSSCQALTP
jgi:hypothetical protein